MPFAYQFYRELTKPAAFNPMSALSTAATTASDALNPGMYAGLAGAVTKGLGAAVGFNAKPKGFRAALSNKITNFGAGAQRLGEYASDITQGILNAGPGIKYDAKKLPGMMLFEQRMGPGADKKITKLTPQRALYWTGNAAAMGSLVGGLKNAVAPDAANAVKSARADIEALINFWEAQP